MRQKHQDVLQEYEAAKSKYDAAAAGYESSRSKVEAVSLQISVYLYKQLSHIPHVVLIVLSYSHVTLLSLVAAMKMIYYNMKIMR